MNTRTLIYVVVAIVAIYLVWKSYASASSSLDSGVASAIQPLPILRESPSFLDNGDGE